MQNSWQQFHSGKDYQLMYLFIRVVIPRSRHQVSLFPPSAAANPGRCAHAQWSNLASFSGANDALEGCLLPSFLDKTLTFKIGANRLFDRSRQEESLRRPPDMRLDHIHSKGARISVDKMVKLKSGSFR